MNHQQPKDPLIRVEVLAATSNPQRLCWAAAHQDYSSDPVSESIPDWSEHKFGEGIVNNCLKFGHFGIIEHGSITFNAWYFPHSVLQQARTHRVGVSFDCQSFRYTDKSIIQSIESDEALEKAFYFRPVGHYTDRKGHKYDYTIEDREYDKFCAKVNAKEYIRKRLKGWSEEHCRSTLLFDYRQHFVVSFNPRSLLHFLDLRYKADAQLEIQWLAEAFWEHFVTWMPEVAQHYAEKRLNKARLSP